MDTTHFIFPAAFIDTFALLHSPRLLFLSVYETEVFSWATNPDPLSPISVVLHPGCVKYTLCANMCFLSEPRMVLSVSRYPGSRLTSCSLPSVAYKQCEIQTHVSLHHPNVPEHSLKLNFSDCPVGWQLGLEPAFVSHSNQSRFELPRGPKLDTKGFIVHR